MNKTKTDTVVLYQKILVAEEVEKQLKALGSLRIAEYNIINDELTNTPLKNPEFHHIRCRELTGNLKYQLDIEIGIVINKKTHQQVTRAKCKNEIELKKFCEDKGWSIAWYSKVVKNIKKYK